MLINKKTEDLILSKIQFCYEKLHQVLSSFLFISSGLPPNIQLPEYYWQ